MGQICCGGPERDRKSNLLSSASEKTGRQFRTVDHLDDDSPCLYSPPLDGGAAAAGAAAARAAGEERDRLIRIVSDTSDAMVPVLSSYLVGMPHADPSGPRVDGHAPPVGAFRGITGPLDRLSPCAMSSQTMFLPDSGLRSLLPASDVVAALARGVDFWPPRPPPSRGGRPGPSPSPTGSPTGAPHELVEEYIDLYVVGNRGRNGCGGSVSAPFPTVKGMFADALPIVENLP